MAAIYQTQLQPWEENQSPSPTEERQDPFNNLSRARSSSSSRAPTSPVSPTNTLLRQLSGDPEHPPPAWKRRSSVKQKVAANQQSSSPSTSPQRSPVAENQSALESPAAQTDQLSGSALSPRSSRSPSDASSVSRASGLPPSARRHPLLTMTTTTKSTVPSGLYAHDSANTSSSSLNNDPVFSPPNPAFRRRGGERRGSTSTRSSGTSGLSTSGMTSEDLWSLGQEPEDMSNPHRLASERPLTTARRLSQLGDQPAWSGSQHHMDMIWPEAPPEMEPMPRLKSKSTTNVPTIGRRTSRLGRKKRQSTVDIPATQTATPNKAESILLSSANSSATDLTKIAHNKSFHSLGARPPSAYYSRDFLTQLAPMDGGYAIAATINHPAAQEEKRRSVVDATNRTSRPPVSRSGMARWSLDGGEHYSSSPGRGYGSVSSAATTSSNLSAPPINSAEVSPESNATVSSAGLPDGASPPALAPGTMSQRVEVDHSPPPAVPNSMPMHPSPLSQSVTQDVTVPVPEPAPLELPTTETIDSTSSTTPHATTPGTPRPIPASSTAASTNTIPIPPIPADTVKQLTPKRSKKELAKEAKVKEKEEAAKVVAERQKKAREDELKRRAERERVIKEKEEAKQKEKEEKERKKQQKKANKTGLFGRRADKDKKEEKEKAQGQGQGLAKAGVPAAGAAAAGAVAVAARPASGTTAVAGPEATKASSAEHAPKTATAVTAPAPAPTPRSAATAPSKPPPSMPLMAARPSNVQNGGSAAVPPSQEQNKPEKKRLGFFGTLKRRFSGQPVTDAPTNKSAPVSAAVKPQQQKSANGSAIPATPPKPQPPHTIRGTPSQPVPSTLDPAAVLVTPPRVGNNAEPATPAPMATSALPPRSTSKSTPNATPSKPVSAENNLNTPASNVVGPGTSPSPVSRHRNSLKGPRPMPRSGSVTSRHSRSESVTGPSSGSPGPAHAASGSFPFTRPVTGIATQNVAVDDEHGLTSGESSALSQVPSHITSSEATYELATPLTSDDDLPRDSKVGMGGGRVGKEVHVREDDGPEREDSGDTVRMERVGVIAAH